MSSPVDQLCAACGYEPCTCEEQWLAERREVEAERIEQPEHNPTLGTWYWVEEEEEGKDPWFGCIIKVGSNFVELESPRGHTQRVHLDEFDAWLTRAVNPRHHINDRVAHYRGRVAALMKEVQELTARLGVTPPIGIDHRPDGEKYALATLSSSPDPKAYKKALIKAKDKTLPKLFKEIRQANEHLATWMKAEMLPLEALAGEMKGSIKVVEDRIFNVGLYAGLTEGVKLVRKGEPAAATERLHLMQRRLYMDEECLLDYRKGGMEFKSIRKFDTWLKKRKNLERILPFPRCMVAFRVRRKRKDRCNEYLGHPAASFIRFRLEEQDKHTFLYVRNGDRLYRVDVDLDLGAYIFPDRDELETDKPLMVRHRRYDPDMWITRDDYEVRLEKQAEQERKRRAWEKANPFGVWKAAKIKRSNHKNPDSWPWFRDEYERENPYYRDIIEPDEWAPFDDTNVYYDECAAELAKRIKYYNRIVLIIQGLYDRSEVMHPHPPVQTWTAEGMEAAIKLVYDGDHTLYDGEPPDFREYVARCNESIDANSVLIGQELFWEKREADKENRRRASDWRCREMGSVKTYHPYGDPGPGYLARPARWKPRARKATFVWGRERRAPDWDRGQSYDDKIRTTVEVEAAHLFNVSAYEPGDYLQFFQDPRTRADYIQWAPILLTAEEYHAGNKKITVQEPWEGEDA